MKVLNCCVHDWANFSHENANALRSVGVYCVDVKEKSHGFGYTRQSKIMNSNQILAQIKLADVVQIMHSDLKMLNLCKIAGAKRVVVYHTGTAYRQNAAMYNDIFNPVVDRCLTDQCEFMFLSAKKIKYIATAIDIDNVKPKKQVTTPYRVVHYPSNYKTKGSEKVVEMVKEIHKRNGRFNFYYSPTQVNNRKQLERMQNCDMYIEMFAPTQNGNPYGVYGVTAFEAAAMGKVVFTQNIYPNVYKEAYGCEHKFIILNTEREFLETFETTVSLDLKKVEYLQRDARDWIVQNHSYKATGKKILELIS